MLPVSPLCQSFHDSLSGSVSWTSEWNGRFRVRTGVSRRFCRLRCCIQVCQLCLVTCRHVSFISLFTLRECEAFRHAQAIVLLSPCNACYCGLSCFYKSGSFDSMTSLHWNLITRWYERVLPPPDRPTLPHPFRSTHSSLHETARLALFTVTFVGFRTI